VDHLSFLWRPDFVMRRERCLSSQRQNVLLR